METETQSVQAVSAASKATDPVCGMQVQPGQGKPHFLFQEQEFHFCSERCLDKFQLDPEFYLSGRHKLRPVKRKPGTTYTCPMDPEISQDHPGDCPKCGMALEAIGASMDAPNPELIDFTKRFWISAFFTLPIMILTMGAMLGLPVREQIGERNAILLELAFSTPVVLWAALPFFLRGWRSIMNNSLNMWTLIMIGVGTSFSYSVVAALAPDIFPPSMLTQHKTIPVYFEASVVIVTLVFLGQLMELKARERTGSAIRALLDLSPKMACRVGADGVERDVPLENILPGDTVRIRPGDAVPVDGTVVEGISAIDESMLTGESVPVEKLKGAAVTAGTLNKNGTLLIHADRVGDETTLSAIVEMVSAAQRSQAPIQKQVDRLASYFVPLIVAIALISFGTWLVWGPQPVIPYALIAAVSVLIIACPCALGLATPMSIMIATGRGAHNGILVRDAKALERFAETNVLVVDKTGTLTEGQPAVSDIIPFDGNSETELLTLAASLEAGSEHPLAEAMLKAAETAGSKLKKVSGFSAKPGMGVMGRIGRKRICLGNQAMMSDLGVRVEVVQKIVDDLREQGKTVVYVAEGTHLKGIISVTDQIKQSAFEAIDALQREGVRVVMATGDNRRTAAFVARQLGIEDVHADLQPQDKNELIEKLRGEGNVLAMAGDGVNDAPALAAADVGIAMGNGSDVAVESAGITLVKGDLASLVRARHLAGATIANIRQNLILAFGYNTVAVPLAAGILYPFTGWLLSPMIAAAAMSLSSVSVIVNALRLRNATL